MKRLLIAALSSVLALAACGRGAINLDNTLANYEVAVGVPGNGWLELNQNGYPDIRFSFDPHERGSQQYEEQAAKRLYGIHSIPFQFIVGRDGKIAAALGGYQAGDMRLEAALARAGVRVESELVRKGEEQIRQSEAKAARASK